MSGVKKSFDQFTLATNGHAGKFLEPLSAGNFRSAAPASRPAGQAGRRKCPGVECGPVDAPAVAEEGCGGGRAAWLFAIKTAGDFRFQLFNFGGIVRIRHSLGERGQLFPRQLAFARKLNGKLNHPRLFRARQVLDFFNHIGRRHIETLAKAWAARKFSFSPAILFHQAQHFLDGLFQPHAHRATDDAVADV